MIPKTIEDAKKQWCPFAMVDKAENTCSFNRDVHFPEGVPTALIPGGCKCLATACGTWVALEKDMGFCGMARC